jgi:hypothetical protein
MIYALVFLIGSSAQALSGLQSRPVPFDYEPPRTIKKIRPNLPAGDRVILYPAPEAHK